MWVYFIPIACLIIFIIACLTDDDDCHEDDLFERHGHGKPRTPGGG